MRLLSHNFLACLQCDTHPLLLHATEVAEIPVEYNAEFTRRMLARIDYPSLRDAFHTLREAHPSVQGSSQAADGAEELLELPETMDGADLGDDSAFVRLAHYALNVVAVQHGSLECPACKTTYAVIDFIPNFVPETK